MNQIRIQTVWLLMTVAMLCPESYAQSRSADDPSLPNGQRRVTLTQSVEPSFHIQPIVHRFQGRRGEVIPFSFSIESTGKAMDVTVQPIRLRQEESGIVLHDSNGQPNDAIRFFSETEFHLSPGESHTLRGEVTVPLAKSNFLSYGVLVRDNGQVSTENPAGQDASQTNATVRFVTQYVLRIDIETGEKDLSEMNQLRFERGLVRQSRGMPLAQTYLVNPTNYAFECQVRGEVHSPSRSRPKPFSLGMPSRVNLLGDDRYLVRIMPHSRIRLEAGIEDLLFPGTQTLKLNITNGRRTLKEQEFNISVSEGDFPALEAQLAFLGDNLSVQPAQVDVGVIRGASRTCVLKFLNSSDSEQTIELSIQDLQGQPLDRVRFSATKFTVRAGGSKSVRGILQTGLEGSETVFGKILVSAAEADSGNRSQKSIPIAVLYADPPAEQIEIDDLESLEEAGKTSFQLMVSNDGGGYVPVHADLQIADARGRIWQFSDGYGRWMMPGESRILRFVPDEPLPAGAYQLTLVVRTTGDEPLRTQTLNITLSPRQQESVTSSELNEDAQAG